MRNVLPIPILALVVALTAGTQLLAQSGEKIYQQTLKSTVWVVVPQGRGGLVASGTGSLIDTRKRLILTNYHVVGTKDAVMVFFPIYQKNGEVMSDRKTYLNGKTNIPGKVVFRDSKKDLALIQLALLPKGAKELPLAAKSPRPGQRLHSIGNPGVSGALWAYNFGTVKQLSTKQGRTSGADGFEIDAKVVETTSPLNPGDSGGPVVNDAGELVAVTQGHVSEGRAQGAGVSIFIDVSEVKRILTSSGVRRIPEPPPAVADTKTEGEPAPVTTVANAPEDTAAKQEKEAAHQLKLAKKLLDEGVSDKGRIRLKKLLEEYPKTKAAEEAKQLLHKKQ
jgi:S1-C subfamily serine protease